MQYLALLRGINVGGKGLVKMSDLKETFIKAGLTNVSTFINSGNVLFTSDSSDRDQLEKKIDSLLLNTFFPISTIVLSKDAFEQVLQQVPRSWKQNDFRKYIAFIKNPSKPDDVIKEAQLKEGIDFIEKGPGVVYMSTMLEGITKSGFPKLATKKVYQNLTIRNFTTVQKLAALMNIASE